MSPSCIFPHCMRASLLMLRELASAWCFVWMDAWCSHRWNGTHATYMWIHTVMCLGTADVRPQGASVCVFFFLIIWFGHSNVWCASTQQSHCHTNTQAHITSLPKLFHWFHFFRSCHLTWVFRSLLPFLFSFCYFFLNQFSLWLKTTLTLFMWEKREMSINVYLFTVTHH